MSNKLIRMRQVREITALSPTTIYRQMANGQFPSMVHLTEKTSAWVEQEVLDYVEAKIADRATA
jgi:prophage regulatory protein